MPPKMTSTLCQKLLPFFVKKHKFFVQFGPNDFVQISAVCGPILIK